MPTCPKCNADMVLRTGSRGDFYGCSKFPTCRGSRDIPKEPPQSTVSENVSHPSTTFSSSDYWRRMYFNERRWWVARMPSITPEMHPEEMVKFHTEKYQCPTCGQYLKKELSPDE